jgi:hypothetical protein
MVSRLLYAIGVVGLTLFMNQCDGTGKNGKLLSQFEKDSGLFRLRISEYEEKSAFAQVLAGVIYRVEVRFAGDGDWKLIDSVHHDDGVQIGETNIVVVNSQTVYVFVADTYLITRDGGRNWVRESTFSYNPSCLIEDMSMDEQGTGKMRLSCNEGIRTRTTQDFGVSWSE